MNIKFNSEGKITKKRALKKMSNQVVSFFPFLPYLNIFTIPTQSAQILP
jgi:hypothetical protein